jgi:predicted metal-binding protein
MTKIRRTRGASLQRLQHIAGEADLQPKIKVNEIECEAACRRRARLFRKAYEGFLIHQ